ncbi:FGGY-family carbohydrate kinase [Martelella soudanensis]|uniref:FGGY-family carbohydrate kinase n=1 Tax=unclassified Martelella TaxID=2629616 RepID=UPI0015E0214D|nr:MULTISPECIES: FGGY-family carbohydrate kinase [unclassified Martelella]
MYLGIDIGTSVIKAALFDENGQQQAEASERMSLLDAPLGWSELDGEATWETAVRVIGDLLAAAAIDPTSIRGIGITGVMVGVWALDEHDRLLRPPILWNDARAQDLVARLQRQKPELISSVFSHSGSVMQLGCTLPVIAWLAENEPDVLAKARHILTAKDFIRYRLTGAVATDESEAAMAPGSAVTRDFHPDQAALLGIEDHVHLLSPVARGETLAGAVTEKAAAATGLAAGTPVAIGTGDTSACVLGAGAHRPGQAVSVLGTTCLNGVIFDRAVYEPRDLGLLFIVPGNRWMKSMVNVAGTTVLDWCLETLCPDLAAGEAPYEALGALAAQSPPGANGVCFIPYLSAAGVIAPRIEPRARAGFHGLAPHHRRADMVRAVYEGLAYAIRDCFEAIGGVETSIRLVGGGARSPFWSQLIADVTGAPVEVPEGTQFGAKGAALCAAVAIGDFATLDEACEATFRLKAHYDPSDIVKPAYDAGFARFQAGSEAALGVLRAVAG